MSKSVTGLSLLPSGLELTKTYKPLSSCWGLQRNEHRLKAFSAVWTRERLVRERAIALGQAIDNSKESNYNSALNSYIEFIRIHNFAIDPTPDTLSLYTVYMSHHIKPKSVGTYLSGICDQLEPFFPDIRAHCNSTLVSRTLFGCQRLRSIGTSRERALTTEDLALVVNHYRTSSNHDDKLFVAQLLTGFYALLRLSELTHPDQTSLHDPRKVCRRTSLVVRPDQFEFLLPGHMADKFFEGNTVVLRKNNTVSDPYTTFTSYVKSRDHLFPLSSPLWLKSDGTIPTCSWFISRLRNLFDGSVTGQSMRAGGATALAVMGVAPSIIQAMGRWSSESFRVHIRQNPTLIQALIFARTQSNN